MAPRAVGELPRHHGEGVVVDGEQQGLHPQVPQLQEVVPPLRRCRAVALEQVAGDAPLQAAEALVDDHLVGVGGDRLQGRPLLTEGEVPGLPAGEAHLQPGHRLA